MSTMRVAQVTRPDGPFEIVERPIAEPGAGEVRVKVQACGVCHSDAFTKLAMFPGISLPRVPGHEVIGVVDALGEGVQGCTIGDRVGVGWHGGQCGQCDHCRRSDFFARGRNSCRGPRCDSPMDLALRLACGRLTQPKISCGRPPAWAVP